MEEIIQFRGEMNKTAKIEWPGKTIYPIGTGATLSFSFISDQSFLPSLISELESIMKNFPVKGKS